MCAKKQDDSHEKRLNNLTAEYCNDKRSMFYKNGTDSLKHIGFLSLKVALENYFSTYEAMKDSLIECNRFGIRINNFDNLEYTNEYCKSCSETIIHFQHFFELIIKDILEKESPLLSIKANTDNIILHKLINGEKIENNEWDKMYSIEFSEALDRFFDLLNSERIREKEKYIFLKGKKEILKTLNVFRNRTWHKGMFLLKYDALDEFIGKYILPLIKNILSITDYSNCTEIFMFKEDNYVNINILDEIIEESKKKYTDSGKIAFLKEMGRASYFLKNRSESFHDYSSLINEQGSCGFILDVKICPVCGGKTLLHRCDFEEDIEELWGDTGNYESRKVQYRYESDVNCINCSFSLNKYVENVVEYGLNFSDFWDEYDFIEDEM